MKRQICCKTIQKTTLFIQKILKREITFLLVLFIGFASLVFVRTNALSSDFITITSDIQFNQGTLDGTVVSGSGDNASVSNSLHSSGYNYYSEISIQHEQVAGDETDFPVALILTDSRFATVAGDPTNGRIQNTDNTGGASGAVTVPADFVVSPNKDGSAPYDFEIVDYDPETGYIEMWVEISHLSSSSDTPIYLVYGNLHVTASQEDVAGTWSNGFEGVWHLGEGFNPYYDSTLGYTSTGGDYPSSVNAKIGGGLDFNGSSNRILFNSVVPSNSFTISYWVEPDNNNSRKIVVGQGSGTGTSDGFCELNSSGRFYNWWKFSGENLSLTATDGYSVDTWYNGVLAYDEANTQATFYRNGAANGTDLTAGPGLDPNGNLVIGSRADYLQYFFDGIIDEFSISSVSRSSNWIATSYQNQNAPAPNSAFWTVLGAESQVSKYQYVQKITIDHTKVDGNLADYPLTFITTDSNLATVANGGYIENTDSSGGASGAVTVPADLIFSSTRDCQTKLDHEIEKYVMSTGEIVAHIRIPSLSSSSDKEIYLCYGNSAVADTRENVGGVWDDNFAVVYHFNGDGVLYDSTVNNRNGVDHVSAIGSEGKVGEGQQFDGVDDYYLLSENNPVWLSNNNVTIENWGKRESNDWITMIIDGNYAPSSVTSNRLGWKYDTNSAGEPRLQIFTENGVLNTLDTGIVINDNSWHYTGLVRDVTSLHAYIDDNPTVSASCASGDIDYVGSYDDDQIRIGRWTRSGVPWDAIGDPLNGYLDELRISSVARSSEWISTTYNNQSDPSTFYNLGAAETASYTSHIIDLTWNDTWVSPALSADVDIPMGTSIDFDVRVAETEASFSSATWIDAGSATSTGTFTNDLVAVPTGANKYVQIRATLQSTETNTPVLNSYTINYSEDATPPVIQVSNTEIMQDGTVKIYGSAIDALTAVTNVQSQLSDGESEWVDCEAVDGTFDELEEDFICNLGSGYELGSSTEVYIRSTDSRTNTNSTLGTGESTDIAVAEVSFGELPETGKAVTLLYSIALLITLLLTVYYRKILVGYNEC